MKKPPEAVGKPAPLENSGDPLDVLVPGLTPKMREVLLQLQVRETEIRKWFAAHPNRVTALLNQWHVLSPFSRSGSGRN